MNITILGGGVAGVVAAKYASKKGFNDVCLIEKETKLGGLHKDIEIDGIHFDIGAFFFDVSHTVLEVFPLKNYMWNINNFTCLSLTNKGNLDLYPVTMKGYLKEWGINNFCLDVIGLILTRIESICTGNKFYSVDDELKYYFGPFYNKTGLRSYVERLYGMSPSEISLQFSGKRLGYIKNALRLEEILKKIIKLQFGELNKWKISPTIYARPASGFSAMYGYIHDDLQTNNVKLNLGDQIEKILIDEKKIIAKNDKVYKYDYLVSSIPLALLCKLSNVPLNLKLEHKPLYSLFYISEEQPIRDCHVLFNFSEHGFWKRITFHSGYYESDSATNYFTVESMPNEEHLKSQNGVNILDSDLRKAFVNTEWEDKFKNIKLIGHHLTPNAYPIYRTDFDLNALEEVKQYFASKSIYLAGRQGEFDYVSSSDAALSSIRAINNILALES